MDYFLWSSGRLDTLSAIVEEYPPQIVRTIENSGHKSMYFVYETDEDYRFFVFFYEVDGYKYTRGFPIVMKKTLQLEDFASLNIGDSIKDVEMIDPIATLYKQGYDTLSDEMIRKLYVNGKETISTVHLLQNGIIRLDYVRKEKGDYIIANIYRSDTFVIPVLSGSLCYKIYQNDYIEK